MSDTEIDYLLSAKAVREKSRKIYELALKGESEFIIHLEKLDSIADFVIEVIKEKYPTLKIPYHSRFNHFSVGGINRIQKLNDLISNATPVERARVKFDLVITSVLLDAGAGNDWKYHDLDDHMYSRSEGLAVASYNMFLKGAFSSDSANTIRADGPGLIHITEEHISKGFQVSVGNPLLGVKGRAELLHRLGKAIEAQPNIFGQSLVTRPGHLVDYFVKHSVDQKISGNFILGTILRSFGSIWPGRIVFHDVNLGDTWKYPKLGEGSDAYIPFHKLSQWMSYSLLEPLEEMGLKITDLNLLTGLAEYRNGGLMLDSGLIEPRFDLGVKNHHPDSRVIVEWRALTVVLLDEIAKVVQKKLNLSAVEFPLAKVLEGGTWWAGRKLAQKLRGGKSPIELISDGTIF